MFTANACIILSIKQLPTNFVVVMMGNVRYIIMGTGLLVVSYQVLSHMRGAKKLFRNDVTYDIKFQGSLLQLILSH